MAVPHQINHTALLCARNAGVSQVVLTAVFAVSGAGGAVLVPVLFALICLGFFFGGKEYNSHQLKAANRVDELMDSDVAEIEARKAGRTVYDCAVYDQSCLDQRMFEAGIIEEEEISVCDDDRCVNCKGQKARVREIYDKKRRAERRAEAEAWDRKKMAELSEADRARVEEYQRQELERMGRPARTQVCQNKYCNDVTLIETHCPTCLVKKFVRWEEERKAKESAARQARILAKQQEAARAKAKAKAEFEARRNVVVNGIRVVRPLAVPEGAVPSLLHGREIDPMATHSFIIWKWTEDGENTKTFRQPVSIDAYSVYADNRHGAVDTWYSVHDPDTGEHLGDYRTVNGKTETRPSKPKVAYYDVLQQKDIEVDNLLDSIKINARREKELDESLRFYENEWRKKYGKR